MTLSSPTQLTTYRNRERQVMSIREITRAYTQWFGFAVLAVFPVLGCQSTSRIDYDLSLIQPVYSGYEELGIGVGVLPFEIAGSDKMRSDGSEIKHLAANYLPVRLTRVLVRSEYIQNAYAIPEVSPAVDFMVRGLLEEVDGERVDVTLTVTRCDGLKIFSKHYFRDLDSRDIAAVHHPYDLLWTEFTNDFVREAIIPLANLETYVDHRRARVAAYISDADLSNYAITPNAWLLITTGALAEREKFLEVGSSAREMAAVELESEWREWCKQTTRINERKRSTQRKQAIGALSLALMFAGGAVDISQASQTGQQADLDQLANSAMVIAEAMESNSEVLTALKEAGYALDTSIADVTQPLIVRLGEEDVRLEGTYEEKLARLHRYMVDHVVDLLEPLTSGAETQAGIGGHKGEV